jgi:hypothetical protein
MTTSGMQLTAPTFCAGLVLSGAVVIKAAPIIGYMLGWTAARVRIYVERRGWKLFEYA